MQRCLGSESVPFGREMQSIIRPIAVIVKNRPAPKVHNGAVIFLGHGKREFAVLHEAITNCVHEPRSPPRISEPKKQDMCVSRAQFLHRRPQCLGNIHHGGSGSQGIVHTDGKTYQIWLHSHSHGDLLA
jgi:hypothetical protein